jgi:predicted alpha/beta superfamily hydrolase
MFFRRIAIVSAACLVLGTPSAVARQSPSLEFGKAAVFHSAVLNEDRRINVFLPSGYDAGTKPYPAIYLLDGSANEDYFHAAGLFDFLATYGVMPPTIVVGIANVDRQRDFTMPSSDPADLKAAPTSGGALKFVSFLERELIPYIDAHYRVTDQRTLIGQSLGGLLATQVLLEKPQLFRDYVIVSPSLWWNKEAMLHGAGDSLKKNKTPGSSVYVSVADEPSGMKEAAERLVRQLRELRPEITCFYEYLPGETHATSLHISLYNAMRLLNKARPARP